MSYLQVIERAIKDINGVHKSISEDHFDSKIDTINLKNFRVKNCISSGEITPSFLDYIHEYQAKLNFVIACSDFEYDYVENDGRMRVKQRESIQNKLLHYYHTNNNGEIPVQKCLNDLLGFRLIIDDFNPFDKSLEQMIENLKSELTLMKCYNRDKDGYKGTHVYFKNGKNVYFPWELQIWSKCDSETNEISHAEHKSKRGYINWPKQYEEGNLREDDK